VVQVFDLVEPLLEALPAVMAAQRERNDLVAAILEVFPTLNPKQ
jgi:hypothetical protein